MEKITSVKDLIRVDKDYKDSSRSSASVCYGGLAGMLVATVKWAGISIKRDQTAYALEILERKKFEDWISKSKPNDKIMYYRGFMFAPQIQKLSPTQDRVRVWKLRNHVYLSYLNEAVTLVQKRHDNLDYEYWAVRL
jgi:hypothetical protein